MNMLTLNSEIQYIETDYVGNISTIDIEGNLDIHGMRSRKSVRNEGKYVGFYNIDRRFSYNKYIIIDEEGA